MLRFDRISSKYSLNVLAISTSEVTETLMSVRLFSDWFLLFLPKRELKVFQNFENLMFLFDRFLNFVNFPK